MFLSKSSSIATLCLVSLFQRVAGHWPSNPRPKTCIVEPCRDGSDDAPAVIKAFQECGQNGRIVFLNETYHINSIMNTTGLDNCEIDLRGTMLVSLLWNFLDLANNPPVEYGHPILAQQLDASRIPESILCMDFWRKQCSFHRPWIRHD